MNAYVGSLVFASPSSGLTPEQLAQLMDDVSYTANRLRAVNPDRPVIVAAAPASPVSQQVAVLFDPRQQGFSIDADIEFAFTDRAPVLVATTSEVITPSSPKLDDDFTTYPGCFLYTSDYLVSQGASGLYFAQSAQCNYNRQNAQFRVPPLPAGNTHWFLAELLRLARTS